MWCLIIKVGDTYIRECQEDFPTETDVSYFERFYTESFNDDAIVINVYQIGMC